MDKIDRAEKKLLKSNAIIIEKTFEAFGLAVRVVNISRYVDSDRYEIEIAMGQKIEDIIARKKDLALTLAAPSGSVYIQAPIPGRSLIGIWAPRKNKGKLTRTSYSLLYFLLILSLYRLSAAFSYWADRLNRFPLLEPDKKSE